VRHLLMLGVPSIFDLASVVLLVSGLMHVPASMWMLLRGGCIAAPLPRPCPTSLRSARPCAAALELTRRRCARVRVAQSSLR